MTKWIICVCLQVKDTAAASVFRSANRLVDEHVKQLQTHESYHPPKQSDLVRKANRLRQNQRPDDPTTMDFEVLFYLTGSMKMMLWFIIQYWFDFFSLNWIIFLIYLLFFSFHWTTYLATKPRVFPAAGITGCAFHWTQAVWKKVQVRYTWGEDQTKIKQKYKINVAIYYSETSALILNLDVQWRINTFGIESQWSSFRGDHLSYWGGL